VEICLENICALIQFQGHGAKVKVTAAKNGRTQVCAPRGHSLIILVLMKMMIVMMTYYTGRKPGYGLRP